MKAKGRRRQKSKNYNNNERTTQEETTQEETTQEETTQEETTQEETTQERTTKEETTKEETTQEETTQEKTTKEETAKVETTQGKNKKKGESMKGKTINKDNDKFSEELKQLKELEKQALNSLKRAPAEKGSVRCELARGKYPQFYVNLEKEKDKYPKGRYLHKDELKIARAYVQKEYDIRILEMIRRREKEICSSKSGVRIDLRDAYTSFPVAKQSIITPYVLPDNEYIKKWEKKEGNIKNGCPITNGFVTEKGETVRSKSEKMIADKLYLMGIPYKYEEPLELSGNRFVFPDFTILNIKTRKEIYWEHFGMMDNPEYCKKALEKIESYENEKIYFGENLFFSFESSLKTINMSQIEHILERIFDFE